MERNIRQEVINRVDLIQLMRYFSTSEIALVFGVSQDYVTKTERLQRIVKNQDDDEMGLGRKGAWTRSKECITYKQWDNENFG